MAQAFNRPVHLVLGFAPGGAADYVSRVLELNRSPRAASPSSSITLALTIAPPSLVAKSSPDGYTILGSCEPQRGFGQPRVESSLDTSRPTAPVTKVFGFAGVAAV